LALFDSSPTAIVSALYPDHTWLIWKFTASPQRFWLKHENRLAFLEWFRKEKGYESLDGFYNCIHKDIQEAGGGGLLLKYRTSLSYLLSQVYPNHSWLPWMFIKSTNKWWRPRKNQVQYIEWLKTQLNMTKMEDLHRLNNMELINHKGAALLRLYSSNNTSASIIHQILSYCYPHHQWDVTKFKGKLAPAKQANFAAYIQTQLPPASGSCFPAICYLPLLNHFW